MKKFSVINSNGNRGTKDGEWFRIHASGCADVKREERMFHDSSYTEEGETAKLCVSRMIEDLNADHGKGTWRKEHFYILPCAEKKVA